jgi:uncharacterized protein (TIGR04255 family)
MAQYTRLSKPPLREAILDIQLSGALPVSFIDTLKEQSIVGFEDVGPIRQGQFALQFGPTVEPTASVTANELLGFRYTSSDKSRVVQLRRNGMTYSILQGYADWSHFRDSAQEIWRQFSTWAVKLQVQRLALRYINVIDVPMGEDIDGYLTSGPRIPPELPQIFSTFFHRILIPFSSLGLNAIINQATEPKATNLLSAILDIDVYGQYQLAGDDQEIWRRLDRIRDIENLIFFSYMTEKALEPYR